ncbi:MAG: amino acid ABC transporter substrate-binding protein [Methanomicrobium sp.]|nr:amino acid ABC transporter substrate-binding protein [Methanomicrobium sp.]
MDVKILSVAVLALAVLAAVFAGCTGTQTPAAPATQAPTAVPGTDSPTAAPTAAVVEKTVYIIGIDGEYPPYSYVDKDGNAQGFDVESAKWIAEDQGFEVKFQPTAWDGIIPALLAKKIDMVYSGMSITPERAAKVTFSDVYWIVNQGVAVKKGSFITIDDIKNGKAKIGTQRGCTAADWIQENLVDTGILDSSKLVLYDNFPLAITDLENGRIDAAMYDTPVVRKSIERKDLELLGTIDTGEEYGIAIRNEDKELLEKMNAGLKHLKESPKWAELVAKYELE